MNVGEIIDRFRSQYIADHVPEYRVADELLLDSLNEAEQQAAQRALLLYDDSTPAICTIPLTVGNRVFALDPRIIKVEGIYYADVSGRFWPLEPVTQGMMEMSCPDWQTATGMPTCYVPNGHSIRLNRAAAQTGCSLQLRVYRLPLADMAGDMDVPEIRPEHHRNLMLWMAHKCALMPDPDGLVNPNAANEFEARFTAAFGEYVPAKVRMHQMTNPPVLRIRPR